MAIKSYKPTSAGRRFQTYSTMEEITSEEPEKGAREAPEKKGRQKRAGPNHVPI